MRERHQLDSGFRTGRCLDPSLTLSTIKMSSNNSINVNLSPAQPQFSGPSDSQWTASSNANNPPHNDSVSFFFATNELQFNDYIFLKTCAYCIY